MLTGEEALLRWTHPEPGKVAPLEFIPIAGRSGQIVAIGNVSSGRSAWSYPAARKGTEARGRTVCPRTLVAGSGARNQWVRNHWVHLSR